MRGIRRFALALTAMGASVLWSQGGEGKGKEAATPEEAVKFVLQAFQAGDPYAIVVKMPEPVRTLIALDLEMQVQRIAYEKALTEKFGKGTTSFPSMAEMLKGMKNIQIISKEAKGADKYI